MNCIFYTDTLFAKEKSRVGNTCAQIFTNREFAQIIPMGSKLEAGTTLDRIKRDVGVANEIFMDNATGQTGYNKDMQIMAILTRMEVRTTEPYSLWQNKAGICIKMIKGKAKIRRFQRNIPKRVWYFSMVWEADIYYRTAGKDGHPTLERLTGDMIDISEWMEFEFYDLLWFWNNQSGDTNPMLGQWLGVSNRVGSAL